jgi:hypothetical protein
MNGTFSLSLSLLIESHVSLSPIPVPFIQLHRREDFLLHFCRRRRPLTEWLSSMPISSHIFVFVVVAALSPSLSLNQSLHFLSIGDASPLKVSYFLFLSLQHLVWLFAFKVICHMIVYIYGYLHLKLFEFYFHLVCW